MSEETKRPENGEPKEKPKKKVAKKLTMKDLETRIDGQQEILGRILELLEDKVEKPKAPKKAPFKFMFVSPHKDFCQVLVKGYKKQFGDEVELVPPVLADFSDKTPGPAGFWGTNDATEAEAMRRKMNMKHRKEVVEVTDDPTYNPEVLREQQQEKKRAIRRT